MLKDYNWRLSTNRTQVWVSDASAYRPISAHAHSQTAGDGRRF